MAHILQLLFSRDNSEKLRDIKEFRDEGIRETGRTRRRNGEKVQKNDGFNHLSFKH